MKQLLYFNEKIITYSGEEINDAEYLNTLDEKLEFNGWTVEKKIAYSYTPISFYKYNINNYWKFTLIDCNGESRLVQMNQQVYVDDQLSELCKRLEFNSKDWLDFDKTEIIKKIENVTNELKTNPYRINTLIAFANEFKEKCIK
jgi:hypothetical protein